MPSKVEERLVAEDMELESRAGEMRHERCVSLCEEKENLRMGMKGPGRCVWARRVWERGRGSLFWNALLGKTIKRRDNKII